MPQRQANISINEDSTIDVQVSQLVVLYTMQLHIIASYFLLLLQELTLEMRKELDEAQKKVTTMKRSVHVAEKNLHVTQLDQNNLSKEVAQNVAKIDSLVDIARKMREHRAEMREDINATRRKHTQTQKVVFTMQLCNLSTSDLMPTFLVFF
jgi:hypothetical protein